MEHLNKQQLVLLTILVSFITSIATGIVTVSLVGGQSSPVSVTNTVERIIDSTVASAPVSSNLASAGSAASSQGTLSDAAAIIGKSTVRIHEFGNLSVISGLGVVVNASGTVMTDKSTVAGLSTIGIDYPDGRHYRGTIIQSQLSGDVVFIAPLSADGTPVSPAQVFTSALVAPGPKLGQLVASIGGVDAGLLGAGIADEFSGASSTTTPFISTTIAPSKVLPGSPLFDINGALLGIRTSSLSSTPDVDFYPVSAIRAALPR